MLIVRMLRAAVFDGRVYEEVREDPVGMEQAIVVLIAALLALVLGSFLFIFISRDPLSTLGVSLGGPLALWLLPAASLFFLGGLARVKDPNRGSDRDLLIAIGFSASPGIFWLIPLPYPVLVVWGWVMASMIIGSKAILNVSFLKALLFVFPGVVAYALFLYVAGLLLPKA